MLVRPQGVPRRRADGGGKLMKLYVLGLVLMVLIPVLLALGIALNIYQGLGF